MQTKYKKKVRDDEKVSGIDCEETQLDRAFREITGKKAAELGRNYYNEAAALTNKTESEKASTKQIRQ